MSEVNSSSMASSAECEHCLAPEVVPTAAQYAPGKLDSSKRNCLVPQGRTCEAQKTFIEKQRYHMGKTHTSQWAMMAQRSQDRPFSPGERKTLFKGGEGCGGCHSVRNLRLRQGLEHIPLGLGGPHSPWVLCDVLSVIREASPRPAKWPRKLYSVYLFLTNAF